MGNFEDGFARDAGAFLRPHSGGSLGIESPRSTSIRPHEGHASEQVASTVSLNDFVVGGSNAILLAATPLIALASRLQSTISLLDVVGLREQAVQEVSAFDERLRASGVSSEDALIARYLVCTFFDSAVLNTPWGAQSDWSVQSLLLRFHKESHGGEKFFQILEHISAKAERYIDLIELQYICLGLGFEGRYGDREPGQLELAQLRQDTFRIIRQVRGLSSEDLAVHWRGVEDRRSPLVRYVPWWIVAVSGLALLVICFVIYSVRLNNAAAGILEVLTQPSVKLEYTAARAPRANRLKQILQPQSAAGSLSVEDFGDKTVVTLVASDLFRSGSATLNPQYRQTLQTVARALDQVPGKVLVIGHTDDQRLRSLRFADNFELSRERAIAVAELLRPALSNPARVEAAGVGSVQPRYTPSGTAENRAKNRRVEIVSVD